MGLYKRKDSRFWWMDYTANGEQRCESTKTSSKDLAKKIWKKREAEIALGRFQIGWPGERMTFAELCEAHVFPLAQFNAFSKEPDQPPNVSEESASLFWGP